MIRRGSVDGPVTAAGRTGQRQSAVAALEDLPQTLWLPLVRAFRRAVEHSDDPLPRPVRPYATWHPERLVGERPRLAIAAALGADARLRQAVAAELGGPGDLDRWAEQDPARLVAELGVDEAAAVLAALGRWGDLATVAAEAGARTAAADRAAAAERWQEPNAGGSDQSSPPRTSAPESAGAVVQELRDEVTELQQALGEARTAASQARERAEQAEGDRAVHAEQVEGLRARVAELEAELTAERQRTRQRLARMRRRVEVAERRARVDADRAEAVAARLDELAAELRDALGSGPARQHAAAPKTTTPPASASASVPRHVPPAQAGRPARFPDGVDPARADGLRSLLGVQDLQLMIDGYNVSKHPAGKPNAALEDQRRWLVGVIGALAARYGVQATVVFDGDDAPAGSAAPSARGVRVCFSPPGVPADDVIVDLVDDLPAERSVGVVTADRDLRSRCAEYGVNLVDPEVLLRVARG